MALDSPLAFPAPTNVTEHLGTTNPLGSNPGQSHQQGGFYAALVSFAVIVVSEIGDKTFIIAAVLAMRNSRLLVFSAALSALAVMTILSALAGSIFPSLISKTYTQILVSLLFLIFGFKMVKEALAMSGNEVQEELDEVTIELEAKEKDEKNDSLEKGGTIPGEDSVGLVSGGRKKSHASPTVSPTSPASSTSPHPASRMYKRLRRICLKLLRLVLSPIWMETFVMTFLAEWGDRSQVATIALAGAEVVSFVISNDKSFHFSNSSSFY